MIIAFRRGGINEEIKPDKLFRIFVSSLSMYRLHSAYIVQDSQRNEGVSTWVGGTNRGACPSRVQSDEGNPGKIRGILMNNKN